MPTQSHSLFDTYLSNIYLDENYTVFNTRKYDK